MNHTFISQTQLKDAERVVRLTMIIILLTAGISKFSSHGGFFAYYSVLFQGNLRIRINPLIVNTYLQVIPYIEIILGVALFFNRYKKYTVYGWFLFIWSLLVGHYILQEWHSVNEMLDYIFIGVLCLILPTHRSWFGRGESKPN